MIGLSRKCNLRCRVRDRIRGPPVGVPAVKSDWAETRVGRRKQAKIATGSNMNVLRRGSPVIVGPARWCVAVWEENGVISIRDVHQFCNLPYWPMCVGFIIYGLRVGWLGRRSRPSPLGSVRRGRTRPFWQRFGECLTSKESWTVGACPPCQSPNE